MNPYNDAGDFVYQEAWTKPVARAIESIFKMAFLDPGEILKKAWKRIQRTYKEGRRDVADRALKVFADLNMLSYDKVVTEIIPQINNSKDYLSVTQYLTEMADAFRNQYKKAYQIAKGR
jgi:predicted nucleic acid-binding protein